MKRLLLSLCWISFCCGVVLAQYTQTSPRWLDLKVPSIDVDGTWIDFANALHTFGFRVSIEDVVLRGMAPSDVHVRVQATDVSLLDLLNQVIEELPDIGWEEEGFLMCRMIILFRNSSRWDEEGNPLNLKISEFSFHETEFESGSHWLEDFLYHNSPEFRQFVNPETLPFGGRAGSILGGISANGYRADVRYSGEFRNTTLRKLLNALACLRVNAGLSWHFRYRSEEEYPENHSVRLLR
jgi:hypothetical protein